MSSTKKCLDQITQNISKLLIQHHAMNTRIGEVQKQCKEEFQSVHNRVSDVRKAIAEVNEKLTHHVSYSKGKRSVWKRLMAPMWVSFGALIGVVSSWFWDTIVNWVTVTVGMMGG